MSIVSQQEATPMRRTFTRAAFEAPSNLLIVQGPDLRSGTATIAGYIPAGILIPDGYMIPYYDTRTKKLSATASRHTNQPAGQ